MNLNIDPELDIRFMLTYVDVGVDVSSVNQTLHQELIFCLGPIFNVSVSQLCDVKISSPAHSKETEPKCQFLEGNNRCCLPQ